MDVPVMDGINKQQVTTDRLTTRVLFSGPDDGVPVLFIHGNISTATWWEEVMLALPAGFRGIAYDQRGYGDADPAAKVDATRGLGDLADDAVALLDHLGVERAHIVGHSMGGSVLWWLMRKYPARILTATAVAPGSPYGFGGVKGLDAQPCMPDYAGSGGGLTNLNFVKALHDQDRSMDAQFSPRVYLRRLTVKPPFVAAREEELLSSVLSTHLGQREYPGDKVESEHWPFFAPGVWGVNNALSPKYAGDVSELYRIDLKPPVLWVRGVDDVTVADNSAGDMGTLGKMGLAPHYPGEDVFPPQPMVSQTRAVLQAYAEAGGHFEEIVLDDCGHSPYLEKPEAFNTAFHAHLA